MSAAAPLTVLTLHNAYRHPGGEDTVFDQESRALADSGHIVHRYREDNSVIRGAGRFSAAASAIWSRMSYRRIADLIRSTGCSVAHFHNTFPLISPSAYYAAKDAGVAVVQTLHNYRPLCPNALLFRNGKVCEDCLGAPIAWRGVLRGCYRQSRVSSAVTAAMLATHRALSTWRNQVDLYIAPSRFCRDKFVEAGFAADRITIKPGFVYPDGGMGSHDGRYWLFVGRLSEEKGLDILIDAWRELGPAFPLKIVGDGPLLPLVAAACRDMPWIEHIGHQPPAEVQRLMGQAQALVFPCQAYTTFGLVVVEAFAKGTPAIVPETGALAELVEHGRNGFRFDARSPWALAAVVRESVSRPPSLAEMRCAARAEFLAKYTAEANMKTLAGIYRLAIALSRRAATAAKS